LYFGGHFGFKMAAIANRNGRNMVQHVLLPVNIHFHWNLFIFEFLTIFKNFILAAILNILKTKSTTLSDDLFLCQVSKGSEMEQTQYVSQTSFGGHNYCFIVTQALYGETIACWSRKIMTNIINLGAV
jgi:hypothetical protein